MANPPPLIASTFELELFLLQLFIYVAPTKKNGENCQNAAPDFAKKCVLRHCFLASSSDGATYRNESTSINRSWAKSGANHPIVNGIRMQFSDFEYLFTAVFKMIEDTTACNYVQCARVANPSLQATMIDLQCVPMVLHNASFEHESPLFAANEGNRERAWELWHQSVERAELIDATSTLMLTLEFSEVYFTLAYDWFNWKLSDDSFVGFLTTTSQLIEIAAPEAPSSSFGSRQVLCDATR